MRSVTHTFFFLQTKSVNQLSSSVLYNCLMLVAEKYSCKCSNLALKHIWKLVFLLTTQGEILNKKSFSSEVLRTEDSCQGAKDVTYYLPLWQYMWLCWLHQAAGISPLVGFRRHCTTNKRIRFGFPVHTKLCFYYVVYIKLYNNYLRRIIYLLVPKCFIAKRKMLSSEQVVIFLLAEGLVSVLMVADCSGWWLLNVGVVVAIS